MTERRDLSKMKGQGNIPPGIGNQPPRRSPRLEGIRNPPTKNQKRPRKTEEPAINEPFEKFQKKSHSFSLLGPQTAGSSSGSQHDNIYWPELGEGWIDDSNEYSDHSIATSEADSDLRTEKMLPYRDPQYEEILQTKASSYIGMLPSGTYPPSITEASAKMCQTLFENKQSTPEDTIFRDDIFQITCAKIRGKNESRVTKDYTPLIVPSVETHTRLSGNRDLDIAVESVNEGWNFSSPITNPRPQPDYAVGLGRHAFSEDQVKKLKSVKGIPSSYFMGTWYMYFPFLTCEVKGSSVHLDLADRQNLHNMTLMARGIVELFRLVNRAQELHQEIVAFSVSHDSETVRIYGNYPVIEGNKTSYGTVLLRGYQLADQAGKEKWTSYTFVKNVYDIWMPIFLRKICSAIDDLPAV